MKLAYVTAYDARDISNWSGIAHFIGKTMADSELTVDYIGPLSSKKPWISDLKHYFYCLKLKQNYLYETEPALVRYYARQASAKLASCDHDLILALSTLSQFAGYLETTKPLVIWGDATFASLIDFYPYLSNLCCDTKGSGNAHEQAALEKCTLAIYSSDWAAQGALENYRVERSKIAVVPFGANIEHQLSLIDIQEMIKARKTAICKLVFVGIEWKRKGGDIAVAVARRLNDEGIKTELTIIGCYPEESPEWPPYIRVLGFLDKSKDRRSTIGQALSEAHFLIAPSRADCTPVVLSEANSFGLPCLSTNVGGIPTVIKDDVNGKTFPPGADISQYCNYIVKQLENSKNYTDLALSSFHEYESRLNWKVSVNTVKRLISERQ